MLSRENYYSSARNSVSKTRVVIPRRSYLVCEFNGLSLSRCSPNSCAKKLQFVLDERGRLQETHLTTLAAERRRCRLALLQDGRKPKATSGRPFGLFRPCSLLITGGGRRASGSSSSAERLGKIDCVSLVRAYKLSSLIAAALSLTCKRERRKKKKKAEEQTFLARARRTKAASSPNQGFPNGVGSRVFFRMTAFSFVIKP